MSSRSIKQWVNSAEAELRALGKHEGKLHDAAYMGTDLQFLGVRSTQLRTVFQAHFANLPDKWETCAKALWKKPVLEVRIMAISLASKHYRRFEKSHWTLFTTWLKECVGWAMVDTLTHALIAPMLEKFPDLAEKTRTWTKSKNLWLRRASLAVYSKTVRNGDFAEMAFEHAAALVHERDPMITKAESWLLRSAIKHFRPRVNAFIKEYESELAPLVLREVRTKLITGTKSGKSHKK